MYGIGYRTVAARMMSGRALKTAGLGAAIAVTAPLSAVGIAASAIPLIVGAGTYASLVKAADAVEARLPGIGRVGQSLAGFAGRGGPAGFVGGALLGYLLAYLAYYAANRGSAHPMAFSGFSHVLSCERQSPTVRYTLGDPSVCNILVPAAPPNGRNIGDPYTAGELLNGFQLMWEHVPVTQRYATVDKYVANGGATATAPTRTDERTYSDEMIGAGYAALDRVTESNPWPDEETGYPAVPKPAAGFKPAVSPAIDAEALPVGALAPNPNTLRLPYRLVVSRRDSGNPYRVAGYTWTAGPRPGEFPQNRPWGVPTPIKVPAVTVDDRGNQQPGRVYPNTRAPARMHERKVRAASAGAAQQAYMHMFGAMTEIGEFIDAIYSALPTKIQTDDYFANGRHELGRDGKLWSIYQNYKAIDVSKMVNAIVFNNLQDAVIGKGGRDITAASGGSPIGRTLGLF